MLTKEVINIYFENFEKSIEGIRPRHFYNYHETNVADDSRRLFLCEVGGKKLNEKFNIPSSTSKVFCGNTAGEFFPPMVVY